MDIGKESDKEIYRDVPEITPIEKPATIPTPDTAPAEPVKVPSR